MNANKACSGILAMAFAALLPMGAQAEQGLNASSQTKVNNAKAQAWAHTNQKQGQQDPALQKRVVNIGSKRNGDCSVNVGTAQAGGNGRKPKDIVVTTKEVINVCK